MKRRVATTLALLLLLAGPLGLLAVEHGAFHHPGDRDGHGAPCPVCHFLNTTSMEATAPEIRLPVLVVLGAEPVTIAPVPPAAPATAPRQSRAPPSLLS